MIIKISLAISLALSVLKLFEILLDARQQRWVQDRVETLALQLSYIRVASLFNTLKQLRTQLLLAVVTVVLMQCVNLAVSSAAAVQVAVASEPWLFAAHSAAVFAVFPVVLRWLTNADMRSFVLRCTVSLVPVVLYFWLEEALDRLSLPPVVKLLIIAVAFVPIGSLFYGGIYLLAVRLMEVLVWLATKILWRIVEYPKGAWSAILFVITTLLGFVQYFAPKP